jgi:hypothetical protein
MPAGAQHRTNAASGMALRTTRPYDVDFEIDEDDPDPEGVHTILCTTPTIDNNVKENTLGFVLQSCESVHLV